MSLQTVVLNLHGGVGQFGVAVFQCQHQRLLLQLFVGQLVGSHVQLHLLVAQLQLLGFQFHAPQVHGRRHLHQQVVVARVVDGVAHPPVCYLADISLTVLAHAFIDKVANVKSEQRRPQFVAQRQCLFVLVVVDFAPHLDNGAA